MLILTLQFFSALLESKCNTFHMMWDEKPVLQMSRFSTSMHRHIQFPWRQRGQNALWLFFTNGSGTSTWKKRESHKQAPNGRFIIHQHLHSATFSPCARHITQHLPSLANTSLLDCGGRNSPLPIGNSVCQTNSQTKHIYYTEPPPPPKKKT